MRLNLKKFEKMNPTIITKAYGLLPSDHFIQCNGYSVIFTYDDVIKWKHFPRYWPFVRGIHRPPVNSPHKGQWRRALMFSLICSLISHWVNIGEAGDLKRHRAHYDVIVMTLNNVIPVTIKSRRRCWLPGVYLTLGILQPSWWLKSAITYQEHPSVIDENTSLFSSQVDSYLVGITQRTTRIMQLWLWSDVISCFLRLLWGK